MLLGDGDEVSHASTLPSVTPNTHDRGDSVHRPPLRRSLAAQGTTASGPRLPVYGVGTTVPLVSAHPVDKLLGCHAVLSVVCRSVVRGPEAGRLGIVVLRGGQAAARSWR